MTSGITTLYPSTSQRGWWVDTIPGHEQFSLWSSYSNTVKHNQGNAREQSVVQLGAIAGFAAVAALDGPLPIADIAYGLMILYMATTIATNVATLSQDEEGELEEDRTIPIPYTPPRTCDDDTVDELWHKVHAACDTPRSCTRRSNLNCEDILSAIYYGLNCEAARIEIRYTCYANGGPEAETHNDKIRES